MIWARRTETLTSAEAEQLALNLAELGRSGLPLNTGLRAAASEMPMPRVSRALGSLADLLETGKDLKRAAQERRGQLPKYLPGYIAAAARSGEFGDVLQQLIEQHQARRELRATIVSSVAYPLVVLLLVTLLVLAASFLIIDDFAAMYREFELELPLHTRLFFWFGDLGRWLLAGGLSLLLVVPTAVPFVVGPVRWQRFLSAVPVFGPLRHWSGVAELSRVLAVLLDHGLPLPESLRVAADAVEDANVSDIARKLADGVERGESLTSLLGVTSRMPASLSPLVAWGEQTDSLAEAFRSAATLFEGRVQLRASMLRSILPAVAYLMVASIVGYLVAALLSPLLGLVSALSYDGGGDFSKTLEGVWLWAAGAVPLGLALLLIAVVLRRICKPGKCHVTSRIFLIAGWILLLGGAVIVIGGFTILSLIAALVVGIIAAAAIDRNRRAERRSLLLAIGIAAERGVPLPPVVESFVAEGAAGSRAAHLADLLKSGVPLPEALSWSGDFLSQQATLAAGLGIKREDLGKSLRELVTNADQRETDIRWALDKFFYLSALAFAGTFLLTFMMMNIIPVFDQIFQEFELALPAMTQLLIETARRFRVVLPLVGGLFLGGLVLAVMSYTGVFPRNLPVIRWMARRYEGARILQHLSLVVRHERPLDAALHWLAERTANSAVSVRLNRVANSVERGHSAWDSMQAEGLIKDVDATVLKAAEKVGNLEWALKEMAASGNRRFALRLRAAVNVLFPMVLLFFCLLVLFVALGLLLPIIDLTSAMSGVR